MHLCRVLIQQERIQMLLSYFQEIFHSMDVSFFENIHYFSNSVIQGENHTHESHNWDWSSLIESN